VLLSDDQGSSWRQAPTPARASLTALQFVDDQRGWALGHLGVILHTRDGGATWTKQMDGLQLVPLFKQAAQHLPEAQAAQDYVQLLSDDGPDKPWLSLHFTDAQHGIVVGAYNLALRTTDGGATWQPLSFALPNPKSLHLYGVKVLGNTVVIVGEQGLLMRSEDGGASFTALSSPYKGTWFGLVVLGDADWLAYGLRGTAFRTTDRGASWQPVATHVSVTLSSGLRLKDGRVLLVTQNGDVLVSGATALNFERRGLPLGAPVADATEAADGTLVVASLRGPLRTSLRADLGAASR
jgi:photosystem II stability/assembly factor-like uncharacterized protein